MSFNLHNRSLLDLRDFSPRDIRYLINLAKELKRARATGVEQAQFKGKNIALIFEKAYISLHTDPLQAVKGVDFVYTDVWVSMGEDESVWAERIAALLPYQVTRALMEATGNPRTFFMHCLPAFHNLESEVAQQIHTHYGLEAMEVTEEVFESEASIVFSQAENRMHAIKAILIATLA